ncbi:MAG TPA: hypothetical protein DIU15_13435 [Deltaproteobacteria bacterium]|nr:hypothetical protein [Deltaproteobacteria bacterium]HCP47043.1 hypothetical protein [Deltaproteobacteria bacterium]
MLFAARAVLPALLLLLSLLYGCSQTIGGVDADPNARNFLRLDGYTLVTDERLRGYLQWIYFADDPLGGGDARVACELWEELDMEAVEVADGCAGCTLQFEGTALQHEDTTCDAIDWTYRTLSMSYGPITEAPESVSDYASEGYSHVVGSRWSPDLGEGDVFEPLFVARPELWDPAEGELGSGDIELSPNGQYRLSGLYAWDL